MSEPEKKDEKKLPANGIEPTSGNSPEKCKLPQTCEGCPEECKGEEEKHQVLHLDIDLHELFTKESITKIPDCQKVWTSREDMSKEYIELHHVLMILAIYIARQINEGPEVYENISKRLVLTKTIMTTILDNLAITGYDAFGVLNDMLFETYMKVNGRKFILQTMAQVARAEEEANEGASDSYIS